MQPEMITSVDQGCAPLEFLDEEAEEVRLVGVVEFFDGAFGDY